MAQNKQSGSGLVLAKSWFVFGLMLALVVLATGCGSQPPAPPPAQPTSAPVSQPQPTKEEPAAAPTNAPAATSLPEATAPVAAGAAVSFAQNVQPIFNNNCVKCHGGEQTKKGLSLTNYASVMAGASDGPVVKAGNPADSPLVKLIVTGEMPKKASRLSDADIKTISEWVAAGAPNN